MGEEGERVFLLHLTLVFFSQPDPELHKGATMTFSSLHPTPQQAPFDTEVLRL